MVKARPVSHVLVIDPSPAYDVPFFRDVLSLLPSCDVVIVPADWHTHEVLRTVTETATAAGVHVLVGDADAVTPLIEVAPDAVPGTPSHVEADRLVHGPRGAYYDHPFDNFTRIAYMWNGIFMSRLKEDQQVTPEDVALCMVAVKMAREVFRHKRDNIVDMHGYLMTLEDVLIESERRRALDE